MWSLLPLPTRVLIVVAIGVIIATAASGLFLLVLGQERSPVLFISLGAAVTTLLFVPLANLLWRPLWRMLPFLNTMVPDLNGTWNGHAVPALSEGGRGEVRPATITIRQSLFDVTVSLTTDQLESHTIRAMLELDRSANKMRIRYIYDGKPPPALAKANPRHEGAACLEVDLAGDHRVLTGRYFTDRGTAGSLEFGRVDVKAPAARRRKPRAAKPAGATPMQPDTKSVPEIR